MISGNVSLYNETDNNSINPTPALAFVGRIKKCNYKINKNFRKFENKNFVLGEKYKNDLDFKKVENLAEFLCFCVGEDIFNTAEACGQNNYLSYGQVRIAVCEDNLEKFKAGLDKYDIRSEQL